MSIATKLVLAMGEIDAVTKEGTNQAQGYKYVKAADVAQEVRKALVKHGIAFGFDVVSEEHWQTERFTKDGTMIGHMNYVSLRVDFEFMDAETGDTKVRKGIGWGSDTGEKAVYKAMTGALKYALRMNFIIPDESDPENEKAEVIAEVERQKKNPSKTEPAAVTLNDRLVASNKLEAEKRAALERTQLTEKQGVFSLDGDILHCIVKGIQKRKSKDKEFLSVTFNGRLANGANNASCFDTELWEPLNAALDKQAKFRIEIKNQFANIRNVIWVDGLTSWNHPDDDGSHNFPLEYA